MVTMGIHPTSHIRVTAITFPTWFITRKKTVSGPKILFILHLQKTPGGKGNPIPSPRALPLALKSPIFLFYRIFLSWQAKYFDFYLLQFTRPLAKEQIRACTNICSWLDGQSNFVRLGGCHFMSKGSCEAAQSAQRDFANGAK